MIRLGKVVLNLKSIRDKLSNPNIKDICKYGLFFDIMSVLSETIYIFVDHVIFFNKIKSYTFSSATMEIINYWENLLWFAETIFGILADIFYYFDYKKKLSLNYSRFGKDEEYDKKIKKLTTNSIRVWSDFIVSNLIILKLYLHFNKQRFYVIFIT